MSSRLLTRTRPRLTNTPSLSESSDTVVASVVHTISLSGQPTSPEPDLHDTHSSPTTTLSDLISRRIQADLVSKSTQSAVSQALRTVSSMSPIAPKHTMTPDNSGISDTAVDISIARTAGNLPPWHQHYRAGPLELLAVPHNKMRQPTDKISEDIAPSVHLNHHSVPDTKLQRPITAKYLPTTAESLVENDEIQHMTLSADAPPGRLLPHVPNQTPPPYAMLPTLDKTGIQETLSSFSNDSVDFHGVIAHVDRDAKTIPSSADNGQILGITRTVLANRIPAPAAIQPSYFDRSINPPSTVPSDIIPVVSKPELLPIVPSAESVPSADQRELISNGSATSPVNIVEIVSVKDSCNNKQEPEPLSVLIQKAILRQHKEKLDKAPDKMTEIAARAQQMKNAYDIENRSFQPTDVLTPCFGQTSEQLSSVTFSNSKKESSIRTDQPMSVTQTSAKLKTTTKSKRRSNKKPYPRRSSSTESSSSSYYYSSYSEDSNERIKWLSLGKDLANYPLYVTKYARCGKCQHKAGLLPDNHLREHVPDALRHVDARTSPSESPSLEPQLNYLHRSSLTKIVPKDTALEASPPSTQLVVHQAAPQHPCEDNCASEPVHAHQITRLQHIIAQKRASKETGPQAKEIIVTAIRRPEAAPTSSTPIADNLAHTSNHMAPIVDLNYNINGFTVQDPDSIDYNEVLFVLSREKSSTCIDATPSSTPYSTRGRLPPRAVKDLSPPISTPAYNSASIQQEAPSVSKKVIPQQTQPSEKQSLDNREELQAILAHPFHSSRAPIVAKPAPKTPSDLSYLSCVNNIMDLHSVSAVSDTPERFQHYHSDSSIIGGSLQHAPSYLSPNPPFYTSGRLLTPDMREETFSNLEEGEIPSTYQHINERFLPPSYAYVSQNPTTSAPSSIEGEHDIPSLVELANCSLTPEEDLVLAKAMEALNV